MIKGAKLSEDRVYRYWLRRIWDEETDSATLINFVMLNPSTADAENDDATVRRCIGFARNWGYGGLIVTNLYAYRARNPDRLLHAIDPIGPENDREIKRASWLADCVIVAWGARADRGRADFVLDHLGRAPLCLGMTREGYPRHPLYVRADTRPIIYEGWS